MSYSISDLGDAMLSDVAVRFRDREASINKTKAYIAKGKGILADTVVRQRKAVKRFIERNEQGSTESGSAVEDLDEAFLLEKMIGRTHDIVPTEFFEFGLLAQRAVGRVNAPGSSGTGFMVGNGIMMTNHHVLRTPDDAASSTLDMDAEFNTVGPTRSRKQYNLIPDTFFLTDEDHDITLVAVTSFDPDLPDIEDFGWHVMKAAQGKILMGEPINIIQHPLGRDKSLVVHNAHFLHLEDRGDAQRFCWYTADTDSGSSGSPVFNRNWDVVAIHHKAIPKTDNDGAILDINGRKITPEIAKNQPERIAYVANEGIRASKIIAAVEVASLDAAMSKIRDDLVALWAHPGAKVFALSKVKKSTFA